METNELKSLHGELVKMMKEIHQICVKHEIKYTMLAGTMLGAIRHKGFIPWDDDMDLGMTYDNYNKFIEVMAKMNHPWLEIDYPLEESYKYFVKVYDKNTTFMEKDRQNDIKGVFVDIFPIVYAGDSYEEVNKRITKCSFYKALLSRKIGTINNVTLKDKTFGFLSVFFPKRFLYNRIIASYDEADSKERKLSTVLFSWDKDTMPSELYRRVSLYDFEDTQFFGVSDYDKYLSDKFGDYMKLPPEDKRIPHHFKVLELNTPYRDYQETQDKKIQ